MRMSTSEQIRNPPARGGKFVQLSALTTAGKPSSPQNNTRSGTEGDIQPRRLGTRAALNRARRLRNGQDLPPHKEVMLGLTTRLLVHFENASNRLYASGELTQQGDVKVLLGKTLPDLFDRITEGLRFVCRALALQAR